MSGLMRSNPEGCDRWRIVNVAGKAKDFLCRVIMVPQKIVRLHDLDIVNLRCLQNLACALRAGDIRARPNLAPTRERAFDANLRPNANDQRNAYVKQPVTSSGSDRVKHSCFKCVYC